MSNNGEFNKHLVCTYDEARDLIAAHHQFFVSNCGCRERKGNCQRSAFVAMTAAAFFRTKMKNPIKEK